MNFDFLNAPTSTTTINTSEITLVNEGRIDVGGKKVKLQSSAWGDFVENVAGLGRKTINRLNDENPGAGTKLVRQLIKNNPSDVTLVADNGGVSRVAPQSKRNLSVQGSQLHGILSTVLDKNPNLELHNVSNSECNTRGSITLVDNRELPFRLPNEGFQVGYNINYDLLNSTNVSEFFNRLVCANGMVGRSIEGQRDFNASSTAQNWFDAFLADENWIKMQGRYTRLIESAIKNTLSVREFNSTTKAVQSAFGEAGLNQFIAETGGRAWMGDYARQGIDLSQLTDGQAANCQTRVNRWDAVNATTFMGRKSKGGLFTRASEIGGNLLTSSYDSANWMNQAPIFEDVACQVIGSESIADAAKLTFGAN
jgi:hypothetical protein